MATAEQNAKIIQSVQGASSFAAVTPNDSTTLAATRGLMVGAAGNVVVLGEADGASVVIPGLVPGVVYPFRVVKILATGTTATGIIALR